MKPGVGRKEKCLWERKITFPFREKERKEKSKFLRFEKKERKEKSKIFRSEKKERKEKSNFLKREKWERLHFSQRTENFSLKGKINFFTGNVLSFRLKSALLVLVTKLYNENTSNLKNHFQANQRCLKEFFLVYFSSKFYTVT